MPFGGLCDGQVFRVFVRLGNFGGQTAKPTVLYTNAKFLAKLQEEPLVVSARPLLGGLVRKYTDRWGRKRVVGNKLLKSSQSAWQTNSRNTAIAKCKHGGRMPTAFWLLPCRVLCAQVLSESLRRSCGAAGQGILGAPGVHHGGAGGQRA